VNVKTLTLVPNTNEVIDIPVGAAWQGIYQFDSMTLRNGAWLSSVDPVKANASVTLQGATGGQTTVVGSSLATSGNVDVYGNVDARQLTAASLTVKSGAKLSHPATTSNTAAEALSITLTGTLTVEAGGAIDVSGRGFPLNTTYLGSTASGNVSGGSHLGVGGQQPGSAPGPTFGSVSRPQENGGGAGGGGGTSGGGTLRIVAAAVALADGTSAIRANGGDGGTNNGTGAGGSVWITTTGSVSGTGVIEARGGDNGTYGHGGGGAVTVEYGAGGFPLTTTIRTGSSTNTNYKPGGSGTLLLKGPLATYGDLTVDNGGKTGQTTDLPHLDGGRVSSVTNVTADSATVTTDRATAIQPYFAGHWVRILDGATILGSWRVSSVPTNKSFVLESNLVWGSPVVQVNNNFQGIYRLDGFPTIRNNASLTSADPFAYGNSLSSEKGMSTSSSRSVAQVEVNGRVELAENESAPIINLAQIVISIGTIPGSYQIGIPAGSISDSDDISEIELSLGSSLMTLPFDSVQGTIFDWPGSEGEVISLRVIDNAQFYRRASVVELPPLPGWEWNGRRFVMPGGGLAQRLATTGEYLLVGNQTVVSFDRSSALVTTVLDDDGSGIPVSALTAGGNKTIALRGSTLHLIDLGNPTTRSFEAMLQEGVTIAAMAAGDQEAILVATLPTETGSEVRFASISLADSIQSIEASAWSSESLPSDGPYQYGILFTPGWLHISVRRFDGSETDRIYSYRNTIPGEAITQSPVVSSVGAGTSEIRPAGGGAAVVRQDGVHIFRFDSGTAWTETGAIPVAPIFDAIGHDDDVWIVKPGSTERWLIPADGTPTLATSGSIAGISQRNLESVSTPDGIILWSSGFACSPVELECVPTPAEDKRGSGFRPVIDGTGRRLDGK